MRNNSLAFLIIQSVQGITGTLTIPCMITVFHVGSHYCMALQVEYTRLKKNIMKLSDNHVQKDHVFTWAISVTGRDPVRGLGGSEAPPPPFFFLLFFPFFFSA